MDKSVNLYLCSSTNSYYMDGLFRHIEKNMPNSHVMYLSDYDCCEQNSKILEYLDSHDVNAIINFDSINIRIGLSFLSQIKSNYNIKLIAYHADIHEYFDSYFVYVSQLYDLILADDYSGMLRYMNHNYNVKYFFIGLDHKYLVSPTNDRDVDISFVGRMDRPGRGDLCSFLQKEGFSVVVYGPGTKNGYISTEEMRGLYSRSKIVINLTSSTINMPFYSHPRSINSRITQLKYRIWEGMCSGALVFTEPGFGLSNIGKDGEDFIVFNSYADIASKLSYYLNHEKERIAIANSGYNITKSATHTHEAQCDNLNIFIEETSSSRLMQIKVDYIFHSFVSRLLLDNIVRSILLFKVPKIRCVEINKLNFLYNLLRGFFYYPYAFIVKILNR
jgi:hypothetical protein